MDGNRILCAAVFLAGTAVLLHAAPVAARQTIVIGSLGFGYDHWERDYEEEQAEGVLIDPDEGDRRQWGAWPEIEVQHNGIHDTLSLRYAPVIRYDDIDETTDVDHYLTLEAERFLRKNWSVLLRDNYVMSSDPTRYGEPFAGTGVQPAADEITQNLGRQRYWTNDLNLETSYTYAEDSDLGLGYAYRVLRDDSDSENLFGSYDEYDRHDFYGAVSRRFNPDWRTEVQLRYVKGLYDDRLPDVTPGTIPPDEPVPVSQDLEEYWADGSIAYNRDTKNTFPLTYRFREADYEGLRRDIWVHELAAGWQRSLDSRTSLELGAGPSYVDADGLDGVWDFNLYADFSRTYQHGNVSASLSKAYDTRNFSGSSDTGLTDLTEARIDLTYRFTESLSSTLFGLYRDEDIVNPEGRYLLSALGDRDPLAIRDVDDVTYNRDIYSAGASLEYTFWRWFTATAGYTYYRQDGDAFRDSYDDHRITFLISASKEIWRK